MTSVIIAILAIPYIYVIARVVTRAVTRTLKEDGRVPPLYDGTTQRNERN